MKKALVLAAAFFCAALASSPANAQSTAFTYQGSLDDAGAPASGLHDFRVLLFNAASGGVVVGSPQCADNVEVIDGVFTLQLDFGQAYATTAERHLEIEVRQDTGLPCADLTGFVALAPRQQITAAPVASHANAAFSLDAADGSPASAVFVDNDGKVGIGTTTPGATLNIKTADEGIRVQGSGAGNANTAWIGFNESDGTALGWVGDGSSGDRNTYLSSYVADVILYTNAAALTAKADGKVGIGTQSPTAKLDVRGDVKLGPSGQYFAASADENLRTIRGTVNANGTIGFGTGWTVARTAAGSYTVFFNTPFSDRPSVVASHGNSTRSAAVATPVQGNVAIRVYNAAGVLTDDTVHFIATGPR